MRYTYFKYCVVCVAIAVAALCSCSESSVELPFTDEGDAQTPSGLVEVRLQVPLQATRTVIDTDNGNDSGSTLTAKWADGDSFGLFYVKVGSGVVTGPIKFTHRSNGHDLQDNIFVGLMPGNSDGTVMDEGTYNYYAVYPYQADSRIDDTSVGCTIPAIQSGLYDDGSDIMWASDTNEEALNPHFFNRLDLNFAHKTHALKITVPKELNKFGDTPIERISIEFPVPVAGKTVYPLANGGSLGTPTPASHIVDVRFGDDNPFANDKEFWVYTAALAITGEVKFTAYNDSEGMMSDYVSTGALNISEPHHITPVKLAVTKGFTVTWFDYTILDESSRLGEPLQTLNLTLPAGLQTADRTAEDGIAKLKKGVDGSYQVAFRTEELADAIAAQSGSLDLRPKYESEHALLSPYSVDLSKFVIASGSYTPKEHNKFSIDVVPYLFEEDFSGVSAQDKHSTVSSDNTGMWLNDVGLIGWSASGWRTYANGYLEISTYIGTSVGNSNARYGRVNTPPMSNLKDNANVTLNVQYNIDGKSAKTLFNEMFPQCVFGTETEQGVMGGSPSGGGVGNNGSRPVAVDTFSTATNGYSTSMPLKIIDVNNCDNNTRLSWFLGFTGGGTSLTIYMYLDNIKVSIAQ